jgi:capsular exopolysaccharide synthesis family protein
VLQPAIDSLDLGVTPAELATNIESSVEGTTVLINISATDASPVRAATIAQAVASSLIATVDRLESPNRDGASPVRLSVVTPATAPATPDSPNTRLYLVLGVLVGISFGIGISFLRSALDTRVRGEAHVRSLTNASILGGISFDADAAKKPLLTQVQQQSPRAESFRQIRTNLQFAHVSHNSKSVVVTSSLPGEGKSTTAVNMAIAMAQAGQRVLLIDADLRRPMVGEYLGLDPNAGLTTVLVGHGRLEEMLQQWGTGQLFVLTSGQIPPNPSELLGSSTMAELIAVVEQEFDAVVIDAPPLLPVTDAAILAQRVGGVVLVVGNRQVTSNDLQKSLSALEMVDADVLGVVINKLPPKDPNTYTYGYYTQDPKSKGSKRNAGIGSARTSARPRATAEHAPLNSFRD